MRRTPGLIITTALSYSMAIGILLRDGIGLPLNPLLFLILGTVLATIRYGSEPALRRHRAGAASRFRLFLVTGGTSYLVLLFATGLPGTWSGAAYLTAGYQTALLLWSYGIAAELSGSFRDHEQLLISVYRQRSETKRQEALRDLRYVIADAIAALDRTRKVLTAGFALMLLVVVLGWINGQFASLAGLLFLALAGYLRYLSSASLEAIADEYRYLGDGGRLPGRYRSRRLRQAAVLLLITAVIAFSLAGNQSLIPYSWLQSVFAWLSGLFPRLDLQAPPPQIDQQFDAFSRIAAELSPGDDVAEPGVLMQMLFRILQGMVRAALVGGLVIFLISPLFSRSFRRSFRSMSTGEALKAWVRALVRSLTVFVQALRRRLLAATLQARNVSASVPVDRRAYRPPPVSAEKQRELVKFSRQFTRLLRWAEKRSVGRHTGEAPGEFTDRLAERFPSCAENLQEIGMLYEKSLFSVKTLDEAETRALSACFKTVIRTDP